MDLPSIAFDAMRNMALDSSKRVVLVQDETCMGGLVLILSNPDPKIVNTALEILAILAEVQENRHIMKNILGLADQLDMLMSHSDEQVLDQTRKIRQYLHHVALRDTMNQRASVDVQPQQKQANVKPEKKDQSQRRRRNSFFVSGVTKSKIIILQIRGLIDRDDVDTCRNCLLTIKGVISITIDFNKKRATLRTRPEVQSQSLAKAIARTMTMAASQVVKDEDGNEHVIPLGMTQAGGNKENEDMPDYPEEELSPIQGDKNMARVGGDKSQEGWNFVKSVGNFLSNSFYW